MKYSIKPSFISTILYHLVKNDGENSPSYQSNISYIRSIIDILRICIREFYIPEDHINSIRNSINNIEQHVEHFRTISKSYRVSSRWSKTKTENNRSSFFIDRVESHYANLRRDVYYPLSTLDNPSGFNIRVTPLWKPDFILHNTISDDFLSYSAIQHISADNKELLNEIRQFLEKMKLYTKNVEALPSVIDSIIRSKFIEAGIYPVKTGNYERIGYYHFNDIGYQLDMAWKNFIDSGRNINSFIRNYNFNGLEFNEYEDYLKLGSFIVGRGNYECRSKMREVLNQIPRNRLILNAFDQLMRDKLDLDQRIKRIKDIAKPFSDMIRDSEYRTLCKCCATQNASIWNFR